MSDKKLNDIISKIENTKMPYNFVKQNYVVEEFYMYYYVV